MAEITTAYLELVANIFFFFKYYFLHHRPSIIEVTSQMTSERSSFLPLSTAFLYKIYFFSFLAVVTMFQKHNWLVKIKQFWSLFRRS